MLELPSNIREVKECFVLANVLKSGPNSLEPFTFRAAFERQRLSGLSDEQLDREITDQDRLRRLNNGRWEFSVVELNSCSVWPRMGGRNWATGLVGQVAEKLENRGDLTDRLWEMKKVVRQIFSELPLIVLRRASHPDRFQIEDGNHRAVAYYLAGLRQAFAFAGTVDSAFNHEW